MTKLILYNFGFTPMSIPYYPGVVLDIDNVGKHTLHIQKLPGLRAGHFGPRFPAKTPNVS